MTTLAQQHDCLLVDLDGTVVRGAESIDGAVDTLREANRRVLFITNNASRGAAEVADHLRQLGFDADLRDVVTSAQSAAHLLASQLPAGSPVLVVGTDALCAEISAIGLRPVRMCANDPVAVVQGHSPHTGWPDLAEAALALRSGALWVATNLDRTLPTERGLLPGNGSMVAALRAATDREPQVAGKPQAALMTEALQRGTFSNPLVVGDRLDTDIAAANAVGLPSLLVLSGVSTAWDAIHARIDQRPSYIARDIRALVHPPESLKVALQPDWKIDVDHSAVTVSARTGQPADDGLSIVRAVASAVWEAQLGDCHVELVARDTAARAALERCSLL
ncbi:HAD family hydrolase (plasmid) [Mycobacterium intracellulare subsp. chimaera]|uniref:HAD-IIA family hydrolase n=1 Tax=Mycobacterium intracellulare TaxID=1767 RepID=UPI0008595C29|nr:HAD-IIA family hydrolase [Mycobacterium intracellulare]AOS95016.1 HAD family hydrolase [Mycobacterium intracellulare subsp. chimaera]